MPNIRAYYNDSGSGANVDLYELNRAVDERLFLSKERANEHLEAIGSSFRVSEVSSTFDTIVMEKVK